jgi:signal transduction histidine kinase/CheY-like chemotaxis protein/HPt (histidine-containing phosphotransfer) domain-containing protein
MRFRTKLFAAWGILVLVLWTSSMLLVRSEVSSGFTQVAHDAFRGTKQSLQGRQADQVTHMRQACGLVMNIPELRALIAESGTELTADNIDSLQERLDSLSQVVGVRSIFVLDKRATLIAQSADSPWQTLPRLRSFLKETPQALALLRSLYGGTRETAVQANPFRAEYGIWPVGKQLFQVVAVPLTFQGDADGAAQVEGALIMATPLTNVLAAELAKEHNCAVSFVIGSTVTASSLPATDQAILSNALADQKLVSAGDFNLKLGSITFRSSFEPLIDPCSRTQVGGTLVQSSMTEAARVQSTLSRDLAAIGVGGLVIAALASFLLSTAITRPVQSLLDGVRRVAGGNLAVSIPSEAGGELGELATAFNDMVEQIRSRRELERLVEESRVASQAKSQFLANMSHEIRTPLAGVMGMTDLLMTTTLDDRQKRYVGLAQSSAKILSTVINDILDFSKIEAGKLELESIPFDLRNTVREVTDLLESKAASKDLRLAGTVASAVPAAVLGDPKRLQQILINLINNAIKFTDSGAVTVNVAAPSVADGRQIIKFEVKDTGIGIPADRMHRLFQSFSQVDASTTRKYGGTGLGLAICKQLAELMGGQIGVDSTPGQGSTFWFTAHLPIAAPAEAPTPVPQAARRVATRRATILVAEDNPINQIVVNDMLCGAGHSCDIAHNGREVLEAVARKQYDLILMDCQMPEISGFEATRLVRQREAAATNNGGPARRMPIIALTASAVQGDRDACFEAGMDDYVAKPIDFQTLMATIDRHMATTGPASVDGTTKEAAAMQAPAPDAAINVPELLKRFSKHPQLIPTLLDRFQTEITANLVALEASVAASQLEAFTATVHSLKGSAGYLSADNLVKVAGQLEARGKARDLDAIKQGIAELQQEIDHCLAEIPNVRHRVAPASH